MEFDWDSQKASSNKRKHGVTFEEAMTVWSDAQAVEFYDIRHSGDEDRYALLGISARSRLLCVVYTERHGDTIRIISARKATREESERYAS